MLAAFVFLITVFLFINFDVGSAQVFRNFSGRGCTAYVHGKNVPLLFCVDATTLKPNLYFPNINMTSVLSLAEGETVEMSCPGSTVVLNERNTWSVSVQATCCGDLNSSYYKWDDIQCKGPISASFYDKKKMCASNRGNVYEVTMKLREYVHDSVYTICFNPDDSVAFYTFHKITIPGYDYGSDEVIPISPESSEEDVAWTYEMSRQQETFNKALGLESDSTKYINFNFLEATFLVPAMDFYYDSYQNSTYRKINTVPVWKTVKYGNWAEVEKEVRLYVRITARVLQVWTGTYQQVFLPNEETGRLTRMYLYTQRNERKLAVPSLLWKALYDEEEESGVVLITVNNPYCQNVSEYIICPDVSGYADWFRWGTSKTFASGYTYACILEDFKEVVTYFPGPTRAEHLLVLGPLQNDYESSE